MVRENRFELSVFGLLALVMLVTRTHSLSPVMHLPDTSLASFFVLGFLIARPIGFAALFGLAFAIDVIVIYALGGSGFCFTPAYWMLLPAYGAMWLAGRMAVARLGARPAAIPATIALLTAATLVSELISSGGFYFFGGRFADPTLAGFVPRLMLYFPPTLLATFGWTAVAAVAYAVMLAARPDLRPAAAR